MRELLFLVFLKPHAKEKCILFPILFLQSINDMYKSSNHLRFVNFSDCTNIFATDIDPTSVHITVNKGYVVLTLPG